MKIIEESESSMVAQRSPWGQTAMGAAIIALGIFTAVGIKGHGLALILLLFLAIAAFGVFEIVSAKRVTIVADKPSATFTISWRSLLGAGERSVAIAEIDAITYRETVTTERTNKGFRKVRKDESTLYLKDGSSLLLDKEQTSSSTSPFSFWTPSLGRSSDEVADRALAGFIGVTFYDGGVAVPPAATGLFGQPALAEPQTPEPTESVAPTPVAPTQAPPRPATAARAPATEPYWEQTPPPWAK